MTPRLPKCRPPYLGEEEFDGYAIKLELGSWAYALDDNAGLYGPGWYPFHREVTRPQPNTTAPLNSPRQCGTGQTTLRSVRISPDHAFYAWRNEYVLLFPYHNDSRVIANTDLYVKRATVRRIGIVTDLRERTVILPEGVPDALREQAEVKGQRILDFLLAARSERRRGRPAPHAVVHPKMRHSNQKGKAEADGATRGQKSGNDK